MADVRDLRVAIIGAGTFPFVSDTVILSRRY